jgi:hypothetical protein
MAANRPETLESALTDPRNPPQLSNSGPSALTYTQQLTQLLRPTNFRSVTYRRRSQPVLASDPRNQSRLPKAKGSLVSMARVGVHVSIAALFSGCYPGDWGYGDGRMHTGGQACARWTVFPAWPLQLHLGGL